MTSVDKMPNEILLGATMIPQARDRQHQSTVKQPPHAISRRQHHRNDSTSSGAARCRRVVSFIDEVPAGISPRDLVTSTTFRPTTTAEDKSLLHYTSKDYTLFAFEDHYYQAGMIQKYLSVGLSWEDCMIHERDGYGNEIPVEEKAACDGGMSRKGRTLHELHW